MSYNLHLTKKAQEDIEIKDVRLKTKDKNGHRYSGIYIA